jgi:hypothetical protein
MNLVYGNYEHDVGDADVSISREGLISALGRMFAIRQRWDVNGRLHGNTVAEVNAKVLALMSAYSVNRQDIYINGSNHIMRSSDTINGTRVVVLPHFPVGSGGENTTFRTYRLAVEAEYAYSGDSVLLSWGESMSFRGTGGPSWGYLETLNGMPQRQMFMERTVYYCKQVGTAIVAPDSLHRNDYGYYWPPSPPIWPSLEHGDRREITYEEPADMYGSRVTHWSYDYSSDSLLAAYPHAASGVVSHLGGF